MPKTLLVLSAAGLITACGQSAERSTANQAAANSAQPVKQAAYCFFKDDELTDWTAKRGADGNITVKGKGHVKDPRYKAVMGTPGVAGNRATIAPSISQNETGYAAPDDIWNLTATIPNSAAVTSVSVTCGDKTVADLNVAAKG